MQIFITKSFSKWAKKEGLNRYLIRAASDKISRGIIDADLGTSLFKKRIALLNRGKSKGLRTIVAYKKNDRIFSIYGFAKNSRSNIRHDELKALKHLAKELLAYSSGALTQAIRHGALIEVTNDE